MKKILIGLSAVVIAVASVPLFAAFEAHVINVTAKIENALGVTTEALDFGTVFPQEHLDKPLTVQLSESFLAEPRVDDIKYIIRQKPKCGITNLDGTELVGATATGHIVPNVSAPGYTINCGEAPRVLAQGEKWGVLPSLCEYISKTPDTHVVNDGKLASFHSPFEVTDGKVVYNDVLGYLSKKAQDTVDNWTIDLAVPCFGGHCAQDWESFVAGINPNALAADYVQDIANEHKIFGCDLWVEVTEVSESTSKSIPLYEELGDDTTALGPKIGSFTYEGVGTGTLSGTVKINENYLTNRLPNGKFLLVLNGPRAASTINGSTNQLLASAGCLDQSAVAYGVSPVGSFGWDGWWSNRTSDNVGVTDTNCDGLDDTTSGALTRDEGYYNFTFDLTAAQLQTGYNFSLILPAGTYSEVQFLIKDLNDGWKTVVEYPGVGETDSSPSVFSFIVN